MNIINNSNKHNAEAGDIIVLNNKVSDNVIHYLIVEDRIPLTKGYTIVNLGASTILTSIKSKTEHELVSKVIKSFEKYWDFKGIVKGKDINLYIDMNRDK